MARAWRIEYEEALYHVLSRGNEKQDIVINDDDRRLFLITAGEMAERFEIDIFAYVLMDNHYHLLFRTHRANLCRSMQWFGSNQIPTYLMTQYAGAKRRLPVAAFLLYPPQSTESRNGYAVSRL